MSTYQPGDVISYEDRANPWTSFVVMSVDPENPWNTYTLREVPSGEEITSDCKQNGWVLQYRYTEVTR